MFDGRVDVRLSRALTSDSGVPRVDVVRSRSDGPELGWLVGQRLAGISCDGLAGAPPASRRYLV